MSDSWTHQLVGLSIKTIEQEENCPLMIRFEKEYILRIESLWRLIFQDHLVLTSLDDGEYFVQSKAVTAISELSEKLINKPIIRVDIMHGTADLSIHFDNSVFQIITDSSGYEAWQIDGPKGTIAVGQGGGNVVVWD